MGESHTGQKQKYLPIIRIDNGKFFGFGESNMPVLDKIEGRFAQILPRKVATDQHRMLAKAMLKVKGVNFTKPGPRGSPHAAPTLIFFTPARYRSESCRNFLMQISGEPRIMQTHLGAI
jgi:hypothetical protein